MYPYWENRKKHEQVTLHTMEGNFQGDTPFYIRKYTKAQLTHVLHQHEMLQINYLIRGSCRHFINEKVSDAVKGDLLIIPPYVPHMIECSEDEDFEMVEIEFTTELIIQNVQDFESIQSVFDFAYLEPLLMREDEVHTKYHLPEKHRKKAEETMLLLLCEYTDRENSYMLMIKGLLLQLLVVIQRSITQGQVGEMEKETLKDHIGAMEKALCYVDEHYMENITIQNVAQVAAFSKSYFGYLFKMVTHQTFVEYLVGKRVDLAVRMLNETSKRVIDICYDCGFRNISHFNRTFKTYVGVSPTEYRAAVR